MRLRYAFVAATLVALAVIVVSARERDRGVVLGFAGYSQGPIGFRKLFFVVTNGLSKPIILRSGPIRYHLASGW